MRATMIVNPRSGRGGGERKAVTAAFELERAGWQVTLACGAGSAETTSLAAEAAGRCDVVIACGGDGTLGEVVQGLQGTDTPLAILPAGTGNDFARHVGMSRDPVQAARQILAGAPRAVDLLAFAGGDARSTPAAVGGDVHCTCGEEAAPVALNVLGVGFDAAVAARMNRQTRLGCGCLSYVAAVLMELKTMPMAQVRLTLDAITWEGPALLVAIANAESYGGGMRIAPTASAFDGLLDLVLVQPMGRGEFLRRFPRVFRGTHLGLPQVSHWQGQELTVESDEPLPVLVDGDVRATTPLRVRVLPGAAKLWLPPAN